MIACNDTGYKGRLGVYEVMGITDSIREMIIERASTADIKNKAINDDKMMTLRFDGLDKAKRGLTSLEEVLRETASN